MNDVELMRAMQAGFTDVRSEFRALLADFRDDLKADVAERHAENVDWLKKIEKEASATNGEVAKAHRDIARHDERLRTLFQWKSDREKPEQQQDLTQANLSLKTLFLIVTSVVAIVGLTFAVMTSGMGFHRGSIRLPTATLGAPPPEGAR